MSAGSGTRPSPCAGWFDQAHFTRDFTALVGQSPAAYAARKD